MGGTATISPVDGRYRKKTEDIREIFSDTGLAKRRIMVEGEYFIFISRQFPQTKALSDQEERMVRTLYNISDGDLEVLKAIEFSGLGGIKATNHDVKAVEYFMKGMLRDTTIRDRLELLHFALTSEDTTNMAYGLMLSDALAGVIIPAIVKVEEGIGEFAAKYADVPIPGRTHGQVASPTTFGKEFNVFASRLERQLKQLRRQRILVKLNGATGNYSAHRVAYPDTKVGDWINFTGQFVESFNIERSTPLQPNFITTQIESHDNYAEIFDNIRRINRILVGFSQDVWRYISDDWIKLRPKDGEVGSSTMPYKVNPIDWENAEGNLGVANALFIHLSEKLPISRLQRDLSDSTVERNIGVAFAHSLIGYTSILTGLGKISVDEQRVAEELKKHPEVVAEALQTILRREGASEPYEQLSKLTRGRKVTMGDFAAFIEGLDVSESVKKELKAVKPENYIGFASELAKM